MAKSREQHLGDYARKLMHLSTWDHVRIRIATWFVTPALWKRMCRVGFCPQGLHEQQYAATPTAPDEAARP